MNSIWSVAPAQADVDSTRYDMVSQCAAAEVHIFNPNEEDIEFWQTLALSDNHLSIACVMIHVFFKQCDFSLKTIKNIFGGMLGSKKWFRCLSRWPILPSALPALSLVPSSSTSSSSSLSLFFTGVVHGTSCFNRCERHGVSVELFFLFLLLLLVPARLMMFLCDVCVWGYLVCF